ncbi:MAG: M23 family metallopeptidase [Myxococcaceae bacterium]|nr:M23 family metallopeptidase [Myxococcaceae bacterium]MCI0668993.1 M23 family metallopeptidase [Myxococcaceae bacterium]
MSRLLPVLLLLLACATPRANVAHTSPGVRPQDAPTRAQTAPPTPEALREALESFVERSVEARRAVVRGAPMPQAQAEAWRSVVALVDTWLSAAPPRVAHVAHVRRTLESELTADARTYGDVPAELGERVMGTLDAVTARLPPPAPARRAPTLAGDYPPRLTWPLEGVSVTSDFGPRRHPIQRRVKMHSGLDLKARPHQPVLAAAPGTVARVGWNGAHGLQVELQHAGGLRTRYSHLSQSLVDEGDTLERGAVLGLAGRTGRTTGVHLHFEVWLEGEPQDPLELLEEAPSPAQALSVASSPIWESSNGAHHGRDR